MSTPFLKDVHHTILLVFKAEFLFHATRTAEGRSLGTSWVATTSVNDVHHARALVFSAIFRLRAALTAERWLFGISAVGTPGPTDVDHFRSPVFSADLRPLGAIEPVRGFGGTVVILAGNHVHRLREYLKPGQTVVCCIHKPSRPREQVVDV